MKEAKSRPLLDDNTPGTFSQRMYLGRRWSANARNVSARFPLGSSSPLRSPATLKAWQGVPPTRRSIAPRWIGHSLNFVRSP